MRKGDDGAARCFHVIDGMLKPDPTTPPRLMPGLPCPAGGTPPPPPRSTEDVNDLSAGAIAGISVGSTVVAAAIILGALRARKRSKRAQVGVQPKSNTHATDVHK